MKIRTVRDILPTDDLYSLRFIFEDLTDEEKFLFGKYGFISVIVPKVRGATDPGSWDYIEGKIPLDTFASYKFLFERKDSLEEFETGIIDQIQNNLRKYLNDLYEFVGESLYEVTMTGEIRKINEGAKKALDKNSLEYKEIIERNRKAFERLSKL